MEVNVDRWVCREIGCPIALHKKCASCEPKFNDFYCPYCYYKQAVVTVLQIQQLREKAMVAKKTLLNAVGTNAERWGS